MPLFAALVRSTLCWTTHNYGRVANIHSSLLKASKSDDIDFEVLKKELSEYLEKRKEFSADERAKE